MAIGSERRAADRDRRYRAAACPRATVRGIQDRASLGRLVCTYRGPGAQRIEPKMAAELPAGAPVPEAAIRHLSTAAIAIAHQTAAPMARPILGICEAPF
jgi:hypothetical protein